jgi:hypothetical protein
VQIRGYLQEAIDTALSAPGVTDVVDRLIIGFS